MRTLTDESPEVEVITILVAEYESLKDDSRWRECVEDAGVDNWGGYDIAMRDYYDGHDD